MLYMSKTKENIHLCTEPNAATVVSNSETDSLAFKHLMDFATMYTNFPTLKEIFYIFSFNSQVVT